MKIALLGDISLNGLFIAEPEKNRQRFEDISSHLLKRDVVFANLETPLKIDGQENIEKIGKGIIHHTTKDVLKQILPSLNISAVSLANNHIYDYMESGVRSTIECLNEIGVKHTGAGFIKEHVDPVILKMDKKRIAFLAYVSQETNPMIDKANILINIFSEKNIINDIKNLKYFSDLIIVSLHWGKEYSYYPTPYQVKVSKLFIDSGADIILGHHPHTIQAYEQYKQGLIFYSLGSLCHGDFFWENQMRSLKRKTKKAYIPVINEKIKIHKILTTKELKGNNVKVQDKNIEKWNKRKLSILSLKNSSKFFHFLITIKEAFFDRLYEYFFGYYRHPLIQLLKISTNLKKNKYIKRDFKKYFNKD